MERTGVCRRGAVLGTVLITLGCSLPGCGSGSSDSSHQTTGSVVPGGAPVSPKAGALAFCAKLAGSDSLLEIGKNLDALATQGLGSDAAGGVKDAGSALRDIAGGAPAAMRPAFDDAASALEDLAAKGVSDESASQGAADAMTHLGEEVQGTCGFALG